MKKLCALFVCLVSLMSFMGMTVFAEETVHLSKTSITLEEGETASLSLVGAKSTVRWRISDTSVCKYSKGTVTAVGKGTAVITAENGGKKYKCKVTVKAKSAKETKKTAVAVSEKYCDAEIPMALSETAEISVSNLNFNGVKMINDATDVVTVKGKLSGKNLILDLKAKTEGTAYITLIDKSNASNTITIKITVSQNPDKTASGSDSSASSDEYDGYADKVVELVNQQRKAAGLNALEKDDTLCANADVRARELVKKFSHTRPDGSDCFTAVTISFGYAGENIAQGQRTPDGVMSSWMSSDGHRSNILSKNFKKIGVGFDPASNSWVQIFTD